MSGSRSIGVVTTILLLSGAGAFPGSLGSWENLAPMPTSRQEVGVGLLEGKIYVVGGIGQNRRSVNTVERFDPLANRWESEEVAELPVALDHVGVAVVGGILYAIGGLARSGIGTTPVNTVFGFDPGENRWTEKAPMPTARGAMGIGVINGLIYVAGGEPGLRGNDFAVYHPATDTWNGKVAQMPTSRNHLAAVVVDGKLYGIGGRQSAALRPQVERYDPVLDQWKSRRDILTARGGIAAAVWQNRIYVFGGEGNPNNNSSGIFKQVEEYDPIEDQWRALTSMALPRHGIGAVQFQGRIYIPGGGTVEGFSTTNRNDAFVPPARGSQSGFILY